MLNDVPQSIRAQAEPHLRKSVGCLAVLTWSRDRMLVRVLKVEVDDAGWSAVLCLPDSPDEPWTIGPFAWLSDDFPAYVTEDYWHLPLVGERYFFHPEAIAEYRSGLGKG